MCIRDSHGTKGNQLFYFATPASSFPDIVGNLRKAELLKSRRPTTRPWGRVIIEKPFGHDLESARELNRAARSALEEHQIYRIDHYLGKETVQNILVFRFGNAIFEPLWNRSHIDHVQITMAESIGVEGRGSFYEETGVVTKDIPGIGISVFSSRGANHTRGMLDDTFNEIGHTGFRISAEIMSSIVYDFMTRPELRDAVAEEQATLSGLLDEYHQALREAYAAEIGAPTGHD